MQEIAPGIWIWRAAHPDWRSGSELVGSYALHTAGGLAVVDPLLPSGPEREEALTQLELLARGRQVAVFVTIPYHVRDAETVAVRFDAPIVGHTAVGKRLSHSKRLVDYTAAGELPLRATATPIGKPRRYEQPIHFGDLKALATGDSLVSVPAGLRVWHDSPDSEAKQRSYRERLIPSLRPLTQLDVEHVLVTHGEPILGEGHRSLVEALDADPTQYRVGDMSPLVRPPS